MRKMIKNFMVYWFDGDQDKKSWIVRKAEFTYKRAALRFAKKHETDVYPIPR